MQQAEQIDDSNNHQPGPHGLVTLFLQGTGKWQQG